MAFKVINNEVITDSSVLQNTTIDESNVLDNVFNVTDGTTSHQVNRGDTVTFSAGAGVTITQLNGTVTISSDAEGIEDLISPLLVHGNHTYIDATYDDINDQVLLAVNITTDGITEGSTNLYYTDTRADARIALQTGIYLDLSAKDTDDLTEGSTNLYYTDTRVGDYLTTNSYATESYADSKFVELAGDTMTGILTLSGAPVSGNDAATKDYVDSAVSSGTGALTTDDIPEGTTNLYFTDARTRSALSAGTGVDFTAGVISIGQPVETTSDVTFATLETTGAATIGGNLTVNGSITYINSNEVNIGDNIIVLNYDETSSATQDAGIEVERGTDVNVFLLWNETTNRWTFTNDGSNYYNLPEPSEYDVDTDTTYDLTIPVATTAIRLAGSDSTNDDITISGGTNVTVTRTSATELTISSTDTNTTYSNGSGLDLTGTVFSHTDTSSQASLTALVGANVVSDIDLDGFGHVTALATRSLTLNDLGFTGATNADYYYGWNLNVDSIDRGDVISGETVDFVAGGGIVLSYSTTNDNTITIAHTDTSSAVDLSASSRTYVTGLTFDTYGHVTGYSTGTETVVDTNNYVSSLAFNTSDGVLTANRSGLTALTVDLDGRYLLASDYVDNDTYTSSATFNTSDGVITFTRNDATTYTVDIDGRYLESYTETQTLQDVTDLGATTSNAISITDTTGSTSDSTGALTVSGGVGIAENLYIGGDTNIAGDTLISGNLTVLGTTTTVDVASLSISDNLIYLNNGGVATITNAVGNGSTVTYTADNNFSAGFTVDVTGVDPSAYNVSDATITSANATSFTISSTATGTYVSGGSARAHTNTNVDLGWAGSYNDGTYRHAGLFRDATDGVFKVFDGYTPEPDDAVDIDTSHASFSLADMQAATFIGTLTGNADTATSAGKWTTPRTITLGGDLTGNVSIDGSANVTLTATVAANSVALGTDTTGNYAGSITAGSGITVTGVAGEGTAYTISHTDTSTAANLSATSRTYVNSLTFDTYGHVTAYGTATETVTDTNTTYSISSETGTGGANLRLTAGGSGSGTDDVLFAGGTNVTVTRTDANTITIAATDTNTTYSAGSGIDLSGTTFSHSDTSTAANLTASSRTYVTGLTFDTYGHVTGYSTGTESVINTDTNTTYDHLAVTTTGGALLRLHGSNGVNDDVKFASGSNVTVAYTDANTITISSTDTDTNNYVTGLSFATGTGVLTATRLGLSDLTVNLDGRYLTSYTETDTLQTVTTRGNTTNTAVVITNTTASTSTGTGALRVSGGAGIAGNAYIGGNAVITGNLTVNGTTTTVNSTTVTLDDPIMTLGGDTAPTADDNKDRGVEFRWHNGTVAKVGFFGFDDSTGKFTFIPDGSNTSEVFSGTKGEIDAYVNWSNIQGAPAYDNYGSWTLYTDGTNRGGITTGEIVNFVGGTNVSLGYSATNNTITVNATDTDTNYYTSAVSFNTTNGVLTLTGAGGRANLTVDLDGRYLESYTETDTLASVTARGNTTTSSIAIQNTAPASSTTTGALTVSGGTGIVGDVYVGGNINTVGSVTINGNTAWHAGNDGAGSGLDADLLDGLQGTYYNQRIYNDATNYLGGYYSSGGSEKPNNTLFGAGKLKTAMLSGTNLGFGGTWNDVLWMSSYNGSDVKPSWAFVGDKYSDNVYVSRQNYDSATWGTGHKLWHSGNDGTGSGLDADLLDGNHASDFALASHTHSNYLPLSGGTITGVIDSTGNASGYRFDGRSFSWNSSMQTPTTMVPHIMQDTYTGWDPVIGIKTTNGFWQFGAYSNDILHLGYMAGAFGSHAVNGFDKSFTFDSTGSFTAAGDVTAYSDERLKTDIVTITNALDKVNALRGVMFNKDGAASTGVIAQEVEEVLPEVVHTAKDDMGTKSVAYGNMVGLLIEAIKEQTETIKGMQAEIAELKARLNN